MFNKKVSYVFRIQKLFVFRFYEEKNSATGNCGGGDGGGGGGDGGGGEGGRWDGVGAPLFLYGPA